MSDKEKELHELQQQELKSLDEMDEEQLAALNEKIMAAQNKRKPKADLSAQAQAQKTGMTAGSAFIGTVLAAGIIGFFADKFLGTSPLFMILMMLVGFGYGIYRAALVMNSDD